MHSLSYYDKHDTHICSSTASDNTTATNSSPTISDTLANDSNDSAPNATNSIPNDSNTSFETTVIKDTPVDLASADPLTQAVSALPGLVIPTSVADQEKIFAVTPASKSSDIHSSDSKTPAVTDDDTSHATFDNAVSGDIEIEHVRFTLILCFYTCVHLPFFFFGGSTHTNGLF